MLGHLGKLIVTKGFKKLPKVQKSPDLVTLIEMSLPRHERWTNLKEGRLASNCIYSIVSIRYNVCSIVFEWRTIETGNCRYQYPDA